MPNPSKVEAAARAAANATAAKAAAESPPVPLYQALEEEYVRLELLDARQCDGIKPSRADLDGMRATLDRWRKAASAGKAVKEVAGDPFAGATDPVSGEPVHAVAIIENDTGARVSKALHPFESVLASREAQRLRALYDLVRARSPAAICLSGGGIRSATFNLGILQSLARKNLLGNFHYLSTVSGGGFIGSWVSAWAQKNGIDHVIDELAKEPKAPDHEPRPIRHLRDYSNYLSPRLSLMSADSWMLVATYFRNLVLNWLVLVTLLAAVLAIPRLCVQGVIWLPKLETVRVVSWPPPFIKAEWGEPGAGARSRVLAYAFLGAAGLLLIVSVAYMNRHAPSVRGQYNKSDPNNEARYLKECLFPLLLAVALLSSAWPRFHAVVGVADPDSRFGSWGGWWAAAFVGFNVIWLSLAFAWNRWYVGRAGSTRGAHARIELASMLISGTVGGLLMYLFFTRDWLDPLCHPRAYVCLALPVFLLCFLLAAILFRALTVRISDDQDREWTARSAGWIILTMVAWAGLSIVVLFGPSWLMKLYEWNKAAAGATGAAGIASGVIAAMAGKSSKTSGSQERGSTSGPLGLLARNGLVIAAVVFVLFLAATVSLLTSWLNTKLPSVDYRLDYACWTHTQFPTPGRCAPDEPCGAAPITRPKASTEPTTRPTQSGIGLPPAIKVFLPVIPQPGQEYDWHRDVLVHGGFVGPLSLLLLFTAVGLVMSHFVSVNKFSLHAVFRNRLVRAYMGASRPARDWSETLNPFTGFDEQDDIPIHELKARKLFHVVNITLNLVSGSKLAWQQRKAESFTATALHCGSAELGYRRSDVYGGGMEVTTYGKPKRLNEAKAISLGTALTISGAAASSNMGYISSVPLAMLLTFFNVRLGVWLGNPGRPGSATPVTEGGDGRATFGLAHPNVSVKPLLAEAFGLTDNEHPYVNLSDGGHFDNLGLYEMVRRRCRVIVVCDAGADPKCAFDDLGNAIRKVYIDMGVRITFDGPIEIHPRKANKQPAEGKGYHAVGTIHYAGPNADEEQKRAENGCLVYVKAAFYGKHEPAHVYNYAQTCGDFPHESTADQFFSESQFESYRALGEFVGELVSQDIEACFRGGRTG